MADKKVNTGLTAEEVRYAFSRALKAMTEEETLAELDRQITAERTERTKNDNIVLTNIAEVQADLMTKYVQADAFSDLECRVENMGTDLVMRTQEIEALKQRVALLEGGSHA